MKPERADWRPNPVTEREIAEDRRQERRRRVNVAFLVLASVGVCPLSCLGTCLGSAGGDSPAWLLVPVVAISALVVSVVRYGADKETGRERGIALRQEFSGVGGWLVEMTIFQGEAVSGRDVGVVWFEEERLYFTGARTSFGLGVDDVWPRVLTSGAVIEPGVGLVLPLRERTPIGPVVIGLRFFSPTPEVAAMVSETAFRHTAEGWIARAEPTRGQLPPLVPGPDLPSLDSLRQRARLATLVWPTIALFAVLAGTDDPTSGVMVGLVGLLVLLWAPARSPRRAWRAVRDRQALEAYNRDQ